MRGWVAVDVLKPNLMLMISIIKKSVYCIKVLILPFNLFGDYTCAISIQYTLSVLQSIYIVTFYNVSHRDPAHREAL